MSESENAPLAILGCGALTAAGRGVGSLAEALKAGRSHMGPLGHLDVSDLPIRIGSEVPPASVSPGGSRLLGFVEQVLGDALEDAVGSAVPLPAARTGVALGTTLGLVDELSELGTASREDPQRDLDLGSALETMAAEAGLRGPSVVLSLACASGLSAAEFAATSIALGRAEAMLVAGADTLGRFMQSGFCTLRGFAPDTPAAERSLYLGEGAAVVALESPEAARARGREPKAMLASQRLVSDGYHLVSPDPSGGGMARAVELALQDAELSPLDIGAVILTALGSPVHERVLTGVLERVLGARAHDIPMASHELAVGHVLAASSPIAIACAALFIDKGEVHGAFPLDAIGSQQPPSETVPLAAANVLTLIVGFGGFNGVALVSAGR